LLFSAPHPLARGHRPSVSIDPEIEKCGGDSL
jgi:hypothetical protein